MDDRIPFKTMGEDKMREESDTIREETMREESDTIREETMREESDTLIEGTIIDKDRGNDERNQEVEVEESAPRIEEKMGIRAYMQRKKDNEVVADCAVDDRPDGDE